MPLPATLDYALRWIAGPQSVGTSPDDPLLTQAREQGLAEYVLGSLVLTEAGRRHLDAIQSGSADQWTHGLDGAIGRLREHLPPAPPSGYPRFDARDREALAYVLRQLTRKEGP